MASFMLLSNHLSSLANMCTLLSLNECPFSFRCKLTSDAWPEELALLCCAICLWRGCFVSPTYKSELHNRVTTLLCTSGCFDLRVDKFLPQCCWIVSEQECVFMKILLNLPDTPASLLDESWNIFKELRQVHFSCSVRFLTSMIKWHFVCHMFKVLISESFSHTYSR